MYVFVVVADVIPTSVEDRRAHTYSSPTTKTIPSSIHSTGYHQCIHTYMHTYMIVFFTVTLLWQMPS